MAEAGSLADRVKQQADIVRVVGEYVRLKKSGQNFTGLPKTSPSRACSNQISSTRQMPFPELKMRSTKKFPLNTFPSQWEKEISV